MAKLKHDVVLAKYDGKVYAVPVTAQPPDSPDLLEILPEDAARIEPGKDLVWFFGHVKKGTKVAVKSRYGDEGPPGRKLVTVVIGDAEVITGEWLIESSPGVG